MAPSAFTPLYGTVRHRPPRTDGGRLWRAKLWIVVVMVSILNAVFAPANTAAAAAKEAAAHRSVPAMSPVQPGLSTWL